MPHIDIEMPDGSILQRKAKFLIKWGDVEQYCLSANHASQIICRKEECKLSESDIYNWCSSLSHRPKQRLSKRLEGATVEIIKLSSL